MKNYYIEYDNTGEFNNIFCNKKTVERIKKCSFIKIISVKKANAKTDRWEEVTL